MKELIFQRLLEKMNYYAAKAKANVIYQKLDKYHF